jgi:hypothetical protein
VNFLASDPVIDAMETRDFDASSVGDSLGGNDLSRSASFDSRRDGQVMHRPSPENANFQEIKTNDRGTGGFANRLVY